MGLRETVGWQYCLVFVYYRCNLLWLRKWERPSTHTAPSPIFPISSLPCIFPPPGTPEQSWASWYHKETGSQYDQANIGTRVWRLLRVSRLLLLGCLLAFHMSAASGGLSCCLPAVRGLVGTVRTCCR